jgi:DNA-binding IclR family transcriptional regulator
LSPDVGSGLWLRRFGAARSVAVPVFDRSGRLTAVVSVALAEAPPDDEDVARAVRAAAEAWSENPNA